MPMTPKATEAASEIATILAWVARSAAARAPAFDDLRGHEQDAQVAIAALRDFTEDGAVSSRDPAGPSPSQAAVQSRRANQRACQISAYVNVAPFAACHLPEPKSANGMVRPCSSW
jgi:hypothetical protein